MGRIPLSAVALASALTLGPGTVLAADVPAPRVSVLYVKSPMRAVVDAARTSLRERRPELLACYQQTLAKDADPEVTVTLSFDLRASGAVSMPKAEFFEPREDAAGDRLLECIRARAGRWTFPAPEGGAAPVSVGLTFSTRPGAAGDEPAPAAGAIDREALGKVLQAHAADIQRCYEQELAQDKLLEGKVTLRWTVQPDGSVAGARVDEDGTTLRNRKVHDCMLARVAAWRFPRPKGGEPAVISNVWMLRRGAQ